MNNMIYHNGSSLSVTFKHRGISNIMTSIKPSSINKTLVKDKLNSTVIGIVSNGKRTIIEVIFREDVF